MPSINMTARAVETLPTPGAGQIEYWDAFNPGFGLRVSVGGRKAWVLMYRHGNAKRRLTLGTYPALSLADAREKAREAIYAVQYKGAYPAAEKKAERAAETFAELADQYLERHAKRTKRSWRKDLQILEKGRASAIGGPRT
jgi:hypothetical protein